MPEYKSAEELYAVVNRMIAALQANESLKSRIGQGDTSIGFKVTDLKAQFCLRFSKGQVSGQTGEISNCAVSVSMSSQTLDKVFSGKQDPESAYMVGSIILEGPEYVAEGLLRYLRDLTNAYKAAAAP